MAQDRTLMSLVQVKARATSKAESATVTEVRVLLFVVSEPVLSLRFWRSSLWENLFAFYLGIQQTARIFM
jgi:hypothetical protein